MGIIAVVPVVAAHKDVVDGHCQSGQAIVGWLVDERLNPRFAIYNQLAISHLHSEQESMAATIRSQSMWEQKRIGLEGKHHSLQNSGPG